MLFLSENCYKHTGCVLRWLRAIYMAVLFTAQSVSGSALDNLLHLRPAQPPYYQHHMYHQMVLEMYQ
jgi:hypothetical protein